MPQSKTDIPHLAFTHHRIGIHGKDLPTVADRVPDLVPLEDESKLAPMDGQRNLGIAYFRAAQRAEYGRYADDFRDRARSILEKVHADGLHDGLIAQILGELYWKVDSDRSCAYAREALEFSNLSPASRATALMILATRNFDEHNYKTRLAD